MKITILNKSLNEHGNTIISFLLEGFPYDVLAEFNKHRLFSISCESSRARKFAAVLQQILYDPFIPLFTQNQPGMSGDPFGDQSKAEQHYLNCREFTTVQAKFMDKLGIHKQDINGLLKPWMKVSQIVTTTHTENFYNLRRGADAKPILRQFADEMYALDRRTEGRLLRYGQWHFPYPELSLRENVAKCGSISYANHQKAADKLKLTALHDKLLVNKHCYDADTEVLTNQGWQYWPNVTPDMELAAVNLQTLESHFELPSQLISYDYQGMMYHIKGKSLDSFVTPGHNMVVSHRKHDGTFTPYQLIPAERMAGRPVRLLASSTLTERRPWELPSNLEIYRSNPDFYKLVGFFVGDGHASVKTQNVTFHLRKNRKVEYLKEICYNLSLTLNISNDGETFTVQSNDIHDYFLRSLYTSSREKCLPNGYLFSDDKYMDALFDGLRNSDGCSKRKTWTYSTTSVTLRDQIQAVAATRQFVAGYYNGLQSEKNTKWKDLFRLNFSERVNPRLETNQKGRSRSVESWVPYQGMVYCATVTTGALITRRNGQVLISGNCVPFEHCAMAFYPGDSIRNSKGEALQIFDHFKPLITLKTNSAYYSQVSVGNFTGFLQYRKFLEFDIPVANYCSNV